MTLPKKSHYETVVVLRPDMSEPNATEFVNIFINRLIEAGSSLSRREYWGSRPLAYPIKKFKRGHFFLYNHTSIPAPIAEMERQFRYADQVLRFMTVRVDSPPTEPSPMMSYAEEERELEEKMEQERIEREQQTAKEQAREQRAASTARNAESAESKSESESESAPSTPSEA